MSATLSFPVRSDRRGTLAVANRDDQIVAEAVLDVIETRMGERVMLPNYGMPDVVFDVLDAGFAARLAFYVEEQVLNYVRSIETVTVDSGTLVDSRFTPDAMPAAHQAAIRVRYTRRGQAVPQELIYPTWRLINGGA